MTEPTIQSATRSILGADGRPATASYRAHRYGYHTPTTPTEVQEFVEARKEEVQDRILEFEFGVDALFKVAAMEIAMKYADGKRPSLKVFGDSGNPEAKRELLAKHKELYALGGSHDPFREYINTTALGNAPGCVQRMYGQHLAYADGLIDLIESSPDFAKAMQTYFSPKSDVMQRRAALYLTHLKEVVETEAKENRDLWTSWLVEQHKHDLRGVLWKYLSLQENIPELAVKEIFGELTGADIVAHARAREHERGRPDIIHGFGDEHNPVRLEDMARQFRAGSHGTDQGHGSVHHA